MNRSFKTVLFASAALQFGLMTHSLAQEQVVKIGHVAPVSGAQAHYGKDNENGARMAIEELNAQGVVIGGKKIKFELQAEDDAADPKQGTAVAQKLCDSKVAGVVGHLNSGTTIPASKIYHDCGIPHVTGAASNPNLTRPGYQTTFRIIANDNALGAGLAEYAAETLNVKSVAIIDDRTAYGQGVADVFKKAAVSKGLKIVDEQFTTDKATDFMAILTAIKAKKPDAIFYGGMDPQGGTMLKQMEQLGMTDVKYFGGDGICTSEIAKLSGGAKTLSNVVCAEGGISLARMPGGTAWKAKYDAKYPGQFQVYSPYTYDATFLIVDAMKRANSIDPKLYTPELLKSNFKGVTGNISFERNGELKNPAITLYGYSDSKRIALPVASAPLTTAPPPSQNPKSRTVTTFFATDRKIDQSATSLKARFTGERGELKYGVAKVNVPYKRDMGEINRPNWIFLDFTEKLDKHMILTSADIVDASKYFEQLNKSLEGNVKRAFIFVHGYNVSFHDAALRTAQMAVDLRINAAPVFYSWPSKAEVGLYLNDEQTVEWTEKNLRDFLEKFADSAEAQEIFVIAHSMGARATTRALANLLEKREALRPRFKELVLAAPDIDAQVFREQILPRFVALKSPITLYASSADKALKMSREIHGPNHPRLGMAGDQIVVGNGIETIDATLIDTDFLGHSYFAASKTLLADLALLFNHKIRAEGRPTLEAQPFEKPSHWAFRP